MKTAQLGSAPACLGTWVSLLLLVLPWVGWSQPQVLTRGPHFGVRNNAFGFDISGTSNGVVVVEMCTNLASSVWLAVSTNTLSGGTAYFSDPQWTNHPKAFYRAVTLAEGLYSANIVGYVNLTLAPSYNLLANPLSAGLTNGANEIMPPIDGEQILTWSGSGFDYVVYDTGFGGWIDAHFNPALPPLLPPGKGFFLFNPNPVPSTVTFVGEVVPAPCTTNTMSLPPGYSLIGSPLPADADPIEAAPVSLPLIDGMQILQWRNYWWYSSYDSGFGGWDSGCWGTTPPPHYHVGEAFFLFNPSAAAGWSQSLPCP